MTAEARKVLRRLGVTARRIRTIPAGHPRGNANWHVWPNAGPRCVLRRYYLDAAPDDIQYEHEILRHLASRGWAVPDALSSPMKADGHWYCLTRFVTGSARGKETPAQQAQRGTDLARLQIDLRQLGTRLGQRPGWQPDHVGVSGSRKVEARWAKGLAALEAGHPDLAAEIAIAAQASAAELAKLGAVELPLTLVHGDFASWNVHYAGTRLAGVIDFAFAHLDTRPYELAMARINRAPELLVAYRHELARHGWPLTELEEAAIGPVYRSFRLGIIAWELHDGLTSGQFDVTAINRQLRALLSDDPLPT